ncbi:glycosidase [Vibrio mediterranei]|uniref:glycosidase n=1 Tax=Vibrio mediterranei TaxID=689 RepID=UPI004068F95C
MTLFKSVLSVAVVSTLMFGCASDPAGSSEKEQPKTNTSEVKAAAFVDPGAAFMSACDNPTISEQGPVQKPLFVVGTFTDSNWNHVNNRKFAYKGNGVYQAVVNEKSGKFSMQYAARDWKPQFTADGKTLAVGETKVLKWGGYAKDTKTTIAEPGQYVWTIKFDEKANPQAITLAKCS